MTMSTSDIITWRLRQGVGKANRELARITRPKRTQRQTDHIYVISRAEIESCDFSRMRAVFSFERAPDDLRKIVGRINFVIADYENSPEELYEIPGVRDYFDEVNCHWPCWSAYSNLKTGSLKLFASCVSDNLLAVNRTGKSVNDIIVPRSDALQFFINAVPLPRTTAVQRASIER